MKKKKKNSDEQIKRRRSKERKDEKSCKQQRNHHEHKGHGTEVDNHKEGADHNKAVYGTHQPIPPPRSCQGE